MASRKEVYKALDSERAYQRFRAETVSGEGTGEHIHSVEEFVLYMDDYLRELKTQLSRTWTPDGQVPAALDTLRKITAMGVACMEQHGAPQREGFEQ